MRAAGVVLVLLVLSVAAFAWYYGPSNTACVTPLGQAGSCMAVHRAHGDREEAAAALLRVREIMFVAAAFLREKYLRPSPSADVFLAAVKPERLTAPSLQRLGDPSARGRLASALADLPSAPVRAALGKLVADLLARWNPDELSEGSPLNVERETAYTVGHGQEMVYCLRQKNSPHSILPDELLFFVALHEMTHIFTPGFVHPDCFWEHFKWVLHEVDSAGIYSPPDFSLAPANYCGLNVNHSPLTDGVTRSIWLAPPETWSAC